MTEHDDWKREREAASARRAQRRRKEQAWSELRSEGWLGWSSLNLLWTALTGRK